MMILQDNRTDEQKRTHTLLIGGTDTFLSGWGKADGGPSFAFWACRPEHANPVESWVRGRGDLQRVRLASGGYRPPSGPGHARVYVVEPGHPSLPAAYCE